MPAPEQHKVAPRRLADHLLAYGRPIVSLAEVAELTGLTPKAAADALDFIDALMGAFGRRYFVALLSAAELYGAANQRPQVFQTMVDQPVEDRDFGRVRLRFYTRRHLPDVQHRDGARRTGPGDGTGHGRLSAGRGRLPASQPAPSGVAAGLRLG